MDKEIKKSTYIAIHIIRFALLSCVLCFIMAKCYELYGGKLAEILGKMENSSNDMKNMIWLYKHAVNILPCVQVLLSCQITV